MVGLTSGRNWHREKHQPSDWLRLQQTIDLIRELSAPGIPGVEPIQPVKASSFADMEPFILQQVWVGLESPDDE
jgi:hypothetical protein